MNKEIEAAPILRAGDHCNQASSLTYDLHRIASALDTLGIPAGSELHEIAGLIDEEVREANRCIGESINDNLHRTQQATNNMISAALSSCLITREAGRDSNLHD